MALQSLLARGFKTRGDEMSPGFRYDRLAFRQNPVHIAPP
jgi:hypothetical protein